VSVLSKYGDRSTLPPSTKASVLPVSERSWVSVLSRKDTRSTGVPSSVRAKVVPVRDRSCISLVTEPSTSVVR